MFLISLTPLFIMLLSLTHTMTEFVLVSLSFLTSFLLKNPYIAGFLLSIQAFHAFWLVNKLLDLFHRTDGISSFVLVTKYTTTS